MGQHKQPLVPVLPRRAYSTDLLLPVVKSWHCTGSKVQAIITAVTADHPSSSLAPREKMRGSAANGLAKDSATRFGEYHEPAAHVHRSGHGERARLVEAAAAADCRYRTATHRTRMMATAARGGLSEETGQDLHQEPGQSTCRLPDDKH
jgi:hypothetical protein